MSFRKRLSAGEFVVLAEMHTPKGVNISKVVMDSRRIKGRVDAVIIPDMDNGVMKMRRIDAITVPSNTVTELKSGGLHIMMFNVANLPEVGSKIPLTLTFENAGKVDINAIAGKAGAKHSH